MGSSNKQNEVEHTSRRRFAKSIATTLVAAPLAASFANAQTPSPATESKPLPTPTPSPTPQQPSPIADAYSEVASARFGKFVTEEEMAKIKEDLEGNVRAAERLRNYKLENGDEPDFVFTSG